MVASFTLQDRRCNNLQTNWTFQGIQNTSHIIDIFQVVFSSLDFLFVEKRVMLRYTHNFGKKQKCVTVVKIELILHSKNPSWKANNFSAIQEICHTLWFFKDYSTFCRFLYIFITSIPNIPETKRCFHTIHSEVGLILLDPINH